MVPVHLEREIDRLKKMISSLSAHVEEAVGKAVRAVTERNGQLARDVIEFDPEIDLMEVEVEEECLKALALHQPVAQDLRFIITVLKVNNDLERIGDLAANIAEQADFLANTDPVEIPYDLADMAGKVREMLRRSLDALMASDASIAQSVREADDEVDALDREMYPEVRAAICRNLDRMESLIRLLRVSQNLERIADHATNIAEDVIYLADGEIIRHSGGEE